VVIVARISRDMYGGRPGMRGDDLVGTGDESKEVSRPVSTRPGEI
jgi:hypothetical protein